MKNKYRLLCIFSHTYKLVKIINHYSKMKEEQVKTLSEHIKMSIWNNPTVWIKRQNWTGELFRKGVLAYDFTRAPQNSLVKRLNMYAKQRHDEMRFSRTDVDGNPCIQATPLSGVLLLVVVDLLTILFIFVE